MIGTVTYTITKPSSGTLFTVGCNFHSFFLYALHHVTKESNGRWKHSRREKKYTANGSRVYFFEPLLLKPVMYALAVGIFQFFVISEHLRIHVDQVKNREGRKVVTPLALDFFRNGKRIGRWLKFNNNNNNN